MVSSTGASNTMAAISPMSSLSSASSLMGVSLSDVDIPTSTADMSPLGPTHDVAIGLAIGIPMIGAVALIAALVYFQFYHGKIFPEKQLRKGQVVSISAHAPANDNKKHDKPTNPVESAQYVTPPTDTAIPVAELRVEYGAA